jgi:hypothetical protein
MNKSCSLLELVRQPPRILTDFRKRRKLDLHPIRPHQPPKPEELAPSSLLWCSSDYSYHGHAANGVVLKNWLTQPTPQHRLAVLTGPSGCGKTALVYCCARELGIEVHSFGTDELDHPDTLEKKIKPALTSVGFCRAMVVLDGPFPPNPSFWHWHKKQAATNRLVVTTTGTPPALPCLRIELHRLCPSVLHRIAESVSQKHSVSVPLGCAEECRGDANRLLNIIQFGFCGQPETPAADCHAVAETLPPGSPEKSSVSQLEELASVLDSQCDDDILNRAAPVQLESKAVSNRSGHKYTVAQPKEAVQMLRSAQNLCCLLHRCTRLQLVDELWLLPMYSHTVDSLFSADDGESYRYQYGLAMDLDEGVMYTKLRLMTRVVEVVKNRWLKPSSSEILPTTAWI